MRKLPPYPLSMSGSPPNPSYINSWYEILRSIINQLPGNIDHNSLDGLQGGTPGEYYHLSSSQHIDLTDGGDSTAHYHSSDRSRANHTGTQTMATISDLPVLTSGTYTPTLTNVANLDASTAYAMQYLRVGNTVTVSGKIDVNPTAAGLVQLGISLPIASNFANIHECAGAAASPGVSGQSAAIVADATNNRAEMEFTAVDLNNRAMYCTFTYTVI